MPQPNHVQKRPHSCWKIKVTYTDFKNCHQSRTRATTYQETRLLLELLITFKILLKLLFFLRPIIFQLWPWERKELKLLFCALLQIVRVVAYLKSASVETLTSGQLWIHWWRGMVSELHHKIWMLSSLSRKNSTPAFDNCLRPISPLVPGYCPQPTAWFYQWPHAS